MSDPRAHRYSSVIAGGSGTRLWPFSRKRRPKQLLPVAGGASLLELAWARPGVVVPEARRTLCAPEGFRGAIRAALHGLEDDNYLGEPVGRDTVNAVGLVAFVLTADHLIEPADTFQRRLEEGFRVVEADPRRIVTFGIRPTHPSSAYGYIERGEAIAGFDEAFHAARFVEKPSREDAERYLAAGTFSWNSGMFIFHAASLRDAIGRMQPGCAAGLAEIAEAYDSPRRAEVMARVYPTLPRTSIDYGVMEPACRDESLEVCTLPMDLSWLDIGSWTSFGETVAADESENRSNAHWIDDGSRGMLVVSDDPSHLVATVGCEDLVIVHTRDATLVCPRSCAEKVKDLSPRIPEDWR